MSHIRIKKLFNKYAGMVYRICSRYTKNKEETEDMMQNVFLKVQEKLNTFQGTSSAMTWIYRIAVNTCIDELRSRKRRDRLIMDNLDTLVIKNIECESDISLSKITLEKILDEINTDMKEVLFLVYVEGLSHRETSQRLGVSRAAVTQRITRFREQMKKKELCVDT